MESFRIFVRYSSGERTSHHSVPASDDHVHAMTTRGQPPVPVDV
jgi:hypothetical protein